VVVLDHLSETQRRAYILADKQARDECRMGREMLASELREIETDGTDLALIGFSDEELEALLEDGDAPPEDVTDEVPEPPDQPVTQPGDVWLIGAHRLICGDCRERGNGSCSVRRCAGQRGRDLAALCDAARVTTPPAASNRYLRTIMPSGLARSAAGVEIDSGARWLLLPHIKEHADDGERDLYVMDLVIAHRRQWGWRFVDTFCWRKTITACRAAGEPIQERLGPVFHFLPPAAD